MVNKKLMSRSIDHKTESDYRTSMLRTILNSRMFLWALLSLPALAMLIGYGRGQVSALELLHPTGEFSARLMIVAMMLSPLVALLVPKPWLGWLVGGFVGRRDRISPQFKRPDPAKFFRAVRPGEAF